MSAPPNIAVLYDARSQAWWRFAAPVEIRAAFTLEAVRALLGGLEGETSRRGLYAVGFVTYEAAPAFDAALKVLPPGLMPLAWFGLYQKPEVIPFPAPAARLGPEPAWEPTVTAGQYHAAIEAIKEHIRAGQTYQVNYTYRLRAGFAGEPWDWFVRLVHAQGSCQGAFLETEEWAVCSASPELFFARAGEQVLTRPMKGTARRGLWPAQDVEQALRLRQSAKDRAENVMIVDMARHDLGRIAEYGSVRATELFEVEAHPTVWQMTSTVVGATRQGFGAIFGALFPAASITGAPKANTMRLLTELETTPRGVYTGAIGCLTPEGDAQFNVAIRTVVVDKTHQRAEYGVGGGIVWDSSAEGEFAECAAKAALLTCQRPAFELLETMRWTPTEGFVLLEQHLARLKASAVYFSWPLEVEKVRRQLAEAAARWPAVAQRVRLVVRADGEAVVRGAELEPLRNPYRVALASGPVSSSDSFLYHKTTQRQVYAQALAQAPECDDVLLWNERGELTESCVANLVVELEGRRLTPPVASGLLAGTARAQLLEEGRLVEAVIRVRDLRRCTRLWLVNSVRGKWEITASCER